jgi:hypothetical protein
VHWICLVYAPRSHTVVLGLACPAGFQKQHLLVFSFQERFVAILTSRNGNLLTYANQGLVYIYLFDSPSVNSQASASSRHICVKKEAMWSFMRPAPHCVWCLLDASTAWHGISWTVPAQAQDSRTILGRPLLANLSLRPPHNRS